MSNNSSFFTIKLWDKSILCSSYDLSDERGSEFMDFLRYMLPHLATETVMELQHILQLTDTMEIESFWSFH